MYVHAHRKDNVNDITGQAVAISINPSVTHRCEMEIADVSHDTQDAMDLQPQEQNATIHVNPSTSENIIKHGISYNVEPVTAEASKNHYPSDPSKEETPLY